MKRVLVTGASGFVGRHVLERLDEVMPGSARAGVRSSAPQKLACPEIVLGDLARLEVSPEVFAAIDVVVHAAAQVHVPKGGREADFQAINARGSIELARKARDAGVGRFVFVSTIGVNGSWTEPGRPYRIDDAPAPHNAYARSKWDAERELRNIAEKSSMEVVIVRPPSVYGKGANANFATMMAWLKSGFPLPLAGIHNSRSFISARNLADILVQCAISRTSANRLFLVSDGHDLSTSELFIRLAAAMKTPARLFPIPPSFVRLLTEAIGQEKIYTQLFGSLEIDIFPLVDILGWKPVQSVEAGLEEMTNCWMRRKYDTGASALVG